ncbi:histidine phosphatase family protein [Paenibacillus dauci]|uniref:histidine phosphatase family protein n=1 Tax=Paenibacillus dauci TaxID=1567106 RepID=UPI00061926A8|nr:histidine phosphatase family protein [Paenibacillus dauci]
MNFNNTIIYFVRHADSTFIPDMERERGISEKGKADTIRIIEILRNEHIDLFISSPYERAIETIRGSAIEYEKEISIVEDLRERAIGVIPDNGFTAAKRRVYDDFNFAYPGGESSNHAQKRAVEALRMLLDKHQGRKMVIGTHGDIMTLMMNYFDKQYSYDFWSSSTMPDMYKMEFKGDILVEVERIWS